MNLGQWLKSLSATDQIILLVLYCVCIYISKVTLEVLIEYYDHKKGHNEFRVRFRITPAVLLGLALIYSLILYQILEAMFDFIP
ncbi:MAG: hypothetical protein ACJZ2B_08620 [Candidatus Neomarinimicrobiota bacterium]